MINTTDPWRQDANSNRQSCLPRKQLEGEVLTFVAILVRSSWRSARMVSQRNVREASRGASPEGLVHH